MLFLPLPHAHMQVDADSSVLRGKLGEMLNCVLGRQAHRAELAAWFSVSGRLLSSFSPLALQRQQLSCQHLLNSPGLFTNPLFTSLVLSTQTPTCPASALVCVLSHKRSSSITTGAAS
jgi:hypothetical protein